jgi:hypothetical protein
MGFRDVLEERFRDLESPFIRRPVFRGPSLATCAGKDRENAGQKEY